MLMIPQARALIRTGCAGAGATFRSLPHPHVLMQALTSYSNPDSQMHQREAIDSTSLFTSRWLCKLSDLFQNLPVRKKEVSALAQFLENIFKYRTWVYSVVSGFFCLRPLQSGLVQDILLPFYSIIHVSWV